MHARAALYARTTSGDPAFLAGKAQLARFYGDQVLTQAPGRLAAVTAGSCGPGELGGLTSLALRDVKSPLTERTVEGKFVWPSGSSRSPAWSPWSSVVRRRRLKISPRPEPNPRPFSSRMGERAVLTMQEGGIPTIVSRGPADLSVDPSPAGRLRRWRRPGQEAGVTNSAAPATFVATFRNFGAEGRGPAGRERLRSSADLRRRHPGAAGRTRRRRTHQHLPDPGQGRLLGGLGTADRGRGDLRRAHACAGRPEAAAAPNALTVTPPGAPSNVCVGQTPGSPLTVRLLVDPVTGEPCGGARRSGRSPTPGGPTKGPMVLLEYPNAGRA